MKSAWILWLGVCNLLLPATSALAQNPILPGFHPDPAPLLVGEWYYLATSSFEYWPGIPIYRSKDLVNWDRFSHAFTRPEQLQLFGTPTGAGAWAPTLSHKNGTFYLASMQRWTYDPVARVWPRVSWVASRDLRSWSDPTWGEPWGIDPAIYHDPVSGHDFLNLMAPNNNIDRLWGIYQCRVDIHSGRCLGPYRSLWNGTLPHIASARPEGPKMFLKDGFYYLLIAEGGTDLLHRSSIARSRSPEGPWEPCPSNPILYNGGYTNASLTVQSTGHGTILQSKDGDWYIVYLARRNVNGSSPLGRETFISHVEWIDGWPRVNDGRPILLSDTIKGLPAKSNTTHSKSYSFNSDLPSDGWYTLRTPYTKIYSKGNLQQNFSGLALHPNVFGLSDRDVPAAVFLKQKSLNMTFQSQTFTIPPTLAYGTAIGISAYLSELVHHDIGVSQCRNSTGLCIYTSLQRNGSETYSETMFRSGEAIVLQVRAEPTKYSLGYRYPNQSDAMVRWMVSFDSKWMAWAPNGWFVFEGAVFALFATLSGQPPATYTNELGFLRAAEIFHDDYSSDYDVGK